MKEQERKNWNCRILFLNDVRTYVIKSHQLCEFSLMDWKAETKLKFGNHLLVLLKAYGEKNNVKPSLRQLSVRAGLEYSHVQRISKGEVDLALTTIVSLAQGLELSPSALMEF